MSITQETANLIDTLAHAASMIGSTAASAKLNQAIVDLIPPSQTSELEAMVTQLQADNAQLTIDANAYRISNDIRGENLEVLRSAMAQITTLATEALAAVVDVDIAYDFRQIIALAALDPEPAPAEA